MGFFSLALTLLAAQIGGGLILGTAEEAYKIGWFALFFPLGTVLGFLFMGSGIGQKLIQFKVDTIAEALGVAYSSSWIHKIASILSMISLFFILIAQLVAARHFLVSLEIFHPLSFSLFWMAVVGYVSLGGFRFLVAIDRVQIIFLAFSLLLACFCIYFSSKTSISPLFFENTDPIHFTASKLLSWLFIPFLFMAMAQDTGQRFFSSNPRAILKAAFLSAAGALLISTIPIVIGLLARNAEIAIPPGSNVLLVALNDLTNPWVTSFVGCAILAAILSTSTSLMNAIGSNLFNDFSFFKNTSLLTSRLSITLIAITALLFSFLFNQIIDLLVWSFAISVNCLSIPFFFALFRKEKRALSAYLAMIGGGLSSIFLQIHPISFFPDFIPLSCSLISYMMGEGISEMFKYKALEKST